MNQQYDPFLGRRNPHRLYRNPERGILAGVCAGLSDYLGWKLIGIRVVFVALCFTPFAPLIIIAYIGMALMVPRRPVDKPLYRNPEEEQFWRATTHAPSYTFGELRHRFREMEHRLRSMEAYVTSPQYEIDRELKRSPNL
jgi:phage shock protein C